VKYWFSWIAFLVAVVLLVLGSINASWFVRAPGGTARLIARHGVAQLVYAKQAAPGGCDARIIEPPSHDYIENTLRSMRSAWGSGADMVEVDVQPTADGKLAVFGDATLDCRTNGEGEVREKTLAELKKLDVGYGYTADGRTFPLRGLRRDTIPSAEQAILALPIRSILFKFASDDPAAADQLVKDLQAARRDVAKRGDAFVGPPAPIERIRQAFPQAWAWTREDAERCTGDYLRQGWVTIVPESCRNGTLLVPIERQWLYAGWPNRLLARMAKVGARVVITGPHQGGEVRGLTLPEQLGKVPSSFNGYVLVDDIWTIGPAFHPDWDVRTREQQDASDAVLARRRAQGK
jgi:glycerophosphoryl diester phosphodiesterase